MHVMGGESTTWRSKGSSLVWSPALWEPLLETQEPIPLRDALAWLTAIPATPPHAGPIVIVGLQPCLEILDPDAAFQFLRMRILRLIEECQDCWPTSSLVFGLSCTSKDWRLDVQDRALLRVRQGHEVQVTLGMWAGAASTASQLEVHSGDPAKPGPVHGGYYLARLS